MTLAGVVPELKAWLKDARVNRLFFLGLIGALAVLAFDQASKYAVLHVIELPEQIRPCAKDPGKMCGQIALSPIFDLTYVENRGASFGMLHGKRWLLTLIVCSVATALVWWLGRMRRPAGAAAIACILGGALGNLYDRLAYGYVVDFLDFSGLAFPWVFNVADSAINVGIAFLLFDAWRNGKEEKRTA